MRLLFLAICGLGVSAFVTQLTLMREMLCIFSGNELVLGIVLGNWMLLTGMGSALGRTARRWRSPVGLLIGAQVLVALLPIADVFLLRSLRNVVFLRGAEVGVVETVASCFVLLAPYCLLTGYLLALACRILAPAAEPSRLAPDASAESASIGKVYFLDNVGDVVGGVLFSFLLIHVLDHFGILYVSALANLLLAALVALRTARRGLLAMTAIAASAVLGLMVWGDLDDWSRQMEYAPLRVVYDGHSPYGSLVVTESQGQYDFIENGIALFSNQDVEQAEETVHFAMAQRPEARRVLLVSGGVSGTAREVLKYPAATVDYVELDPLILRAAEQFLPGSLGDPRIRVINTDGRLLIKQTAERYDVVIVDVPDPATSQINRFYTLEFYGEVKRVLAPGGVLCFSLGHYGNYLSRELANLVDVGHQTCSGQFANVLMFPAGRILFLASDGPLSADVVERLKGAGIQTRWLKPSYLKSVLAPDRMAAVGRAVSGSAPVNTDFNPILYFYHLRWWMSQFQVRLGLLEAGLLVLLGVYVARLRPVPLAVFTTGLAASGLEVVLLLGFQILYGSVYHQVGLIVTMFMLGLGGGSLTMNRVLPGRSRRDLVWLQLSVAAYAACLPLGLVGLGKLGGAVAPAISQVAIPLATLGLGVLVGMEFPLAGKVLHQQTGTAAATAGDITATAARLYTADYLGAALGALLVSTLLIPLWGVTAVCLLVAGLNVFSGGVLAVTARRW